jgi:hypothetical protein
MALEAAWRQAKLKSLLMNLRNDLCVKLCALGSQNGNSSLVLSIAEDPKMSQRFVQAPKIIGKNLKPAMDEDGTNSQCHAWLGGVQQAGDETLGTPQVCAIYWDSFYAENPDAVTLLNDYFTYLVTNRYMGGLGQYGIEPAGVFLKSLVVDTRLSSNHPPSSPLQDGDIVNMLEGWINNNLLPQPSNNYDSLYVILTPEGSIVDLNGTLSNDPVNGFGGYHSAALMGGFLGIGKQNLFYAVIPWPGVNMIPADFHDFATEFLTVPISHEFVEATTDRNENGWISSNGCEIADICEVGGTVTNGGAVWVGGWLVTTFWSNANNTCIPTNGTLNCVVFGAGSYRWYSDGFPSGPAAQMEALISSGNTMQNIVFAPNGTCVVIGANNYRTYAGGFPNDATTQIETMITAGNTLETIVFAPNGAWVVIGANNYRVYSGGFPNDAITQIEAMIAAGDIINNVIFAPNGRWMLIGAGNYRWYSGGFPQSAINISESFYSSGSVVLNVVFLPNWGSIAIGSNGLFNTTSNVDAEVFTLLDNATASSTLLNLVLAPVP